MVTPAVPELRTARLLLRGDPVPLFELVLSPRAAKRAVPVLGAVAAAGIAALARPGVRVIAP